MKIKSRAKINISLGILGKLKNKLHRIESTFFFLNLHDDIYIKKINKKKHKIIFFGKFSRGIGKTNSISNLLKLLEKKNKLSGQKYLIKVNKKIPQKSGMGGGSMNASSLLKYFIKNLKLKISPNEMLEITSEIGADVIIGIQNNNSILFGDGKIIKIHKKVKFYTLLVKPDFGCSTRDIYSEVKSFSKPILKKKRIKNLNNQFFSNLRNDLEEPAFKKYPVLKKLKIYMEKLNKILFVRMTGSGSTMIGYFNSKKAALNATKILSKKYKKYWCILSKTI
jgi:4-diphosphocytidyl-2-C-methyl-D-erythritol kinase